MSVRAFIERHPKASRIVAVLGLFPVYFLINVHSNLAAPHDLTTPLDRAIPFWPTWQLVYAFVYIFMLFPVAVVRDTELFKRVARGYLWVLLFSFCVFTIFPVRIVRPPLTSTSSYMEWGLKLNYFLDDPNNCFPSLHLSIAFLGALAARRANPRLGWPALATATAIGLSTLFVKQHFVADVVSGIAVAFAADRWLVGRRAVPDPPDGPPAPLAYPTWVALAIPAAYLLTVGLFYPFYRAGWRPWE